MDPDIKITAQIEAHRPEACRFTADRPILPDAWAQFADPDQAAGSPLAERLFAIEGIASVRISGSAVTVVKDGYEEWRPAAVKVGAAIREVLRSGAPPVRPERATPRLPDVDLKNKAQEIFDSRINPAVAGHGGFVELLDVKDNKIFLRLGGGCQGCGMADVTLRQGIEATLREELPQIDEVLDATDHASGTNPFYSPSKK